MIEKLKNNPIGFYGVVVVYETPTNEQLMDKINEIIDYLNKREVGNV